VFFRYGKKTLKSGVPIMGLIFRNLFPQSSKRQKFMAG
jgi:hypothetical protein